MASGISVWVYSSCTAGRADGYWPIWGCYQSTNSQSCMHIGPSSIIPTFPFFKYPLFHPSHFLFQPWRPFPPFITPICYNPFHIAISFMPTFSLPVYMLHSLHPYSHANTSLITTLLSNAHLTHSFPHHPTFIVSYPYIPSIHPIPTISAMFIFPHHTPSIPIFQFHHSAHLSYSFTISPICPPHAWIHTYISPWVVPLIILYTHFYHGATHFDVLLFSLPRLMPFEPEPDKRPLSHGPSLDISSCSMLLGIHATAWYAICIDVNFRRWFGQNGDTLSFTIQGPHWCTICHSCGHSMQGLRESIEVGLVVRHRYSFLPRRRSHA